MPEAKREVSQGGEVLGGGDWRVKIHYIYRLLGYPSRTASHFLSASSSPSKLHLFYQQKDKVITELSLPPKDCIGFNLDKTPD